MNSKKKKYLLVTGCAGFIGFHTCIKFLDESNYYLVGVDNLNNYYDKKIKINRLKLLKEKNNFFFEKVDLKNHKKLSILFKKYKFEKIINLAAQAGVRESIKDPYTYLQNNIVSFVNLLEIAKERNIFNIITASSSSVYGNSKLKLLSEKSNTDNPNSFYAASKKTNEIIAKSYSNLYNMNIICLRFFTVYGPYGRPDMAIYKFTKNIINKKNINLYNNGIHKRDFTYISDVVEGISLIEKKINKSNKKFEIVNIGFGKSIKLITLVKEIEKKLNIKAKVKKIPFQKGDVKNTHSNNSKAKKLYNYNPKIGISKGLDQFINWYLNYSKNK